MVIEGFIKYAKEDGDEHNPAIWCLEFKILATNLCSSYACGRTTYLPGRDSDGPISAGF